MLLLPYSVWLNPVIGFFVILARLQTKSFLAFIEQNRLIGPVGIGYPEIDAVAFTSLLLIPGLISAMCK